MRKLLTALRDSGDLVTVVREVDPRFELAAVTAVLQRTSDRAILFRKVKGSQLPVVTNLYGSRRRVVQMIGGAGRRFAPRFAELLKHYEGGAALIGEHIEAVAGDALISGKLSDLPIPTCFEKDAGPYLTGAVFSRKRPGYRHRESFLSSRASDR